MRETSLMAKVIVPNPVTSTPAQRMAWIREQHRLYARDLVVDHLLGTSDQQYPFAAQAEAFSAAAGFGLQCGATNDEIITAAQAEWDDATRRVTACIEQLRRRVWRMCRAQTAPVLIRDTADSICDQHSVYINVEHLAPLLKNIWDAAQPRRRRRYG